MVNPRAESTDPPSLKLALARVLDAETAFLGRITAHVRVVLVGLWLAVAGFFAMFGITSSSG